MKVARHNPTTSRFETVHRCYSCQLVRINGVVCHEIGCPDAWRDRLRECKWCGTDFVPTERSQAFCESSCAESYNS